MMYDDTGSFRHRMAARGVVQMPVGIYDAWGKDRSAALATGHSQREQFMTIPSRAKAVTVQVPDAREETNTAEVELIASRPNTDGLPAITGFEPSENLAAQYLAILQRSNSDASSSRLEDVLGVFTDRDSLSVAKQLISHAFNRAMLEIAYRSRTSDVLIETVPLCDPNRNRFDHRVAVTLMERLGVSIYDAGPIIAQLYSEVRSFLGEFALAYDWGVVEQSNGRLELRLTPRDTIRTERPPSIIRNDWFDR